MSERRLYDVMFENGQISTIEAEDAEDAKAHATLLSLAGRLGSMDRAREKMRQGCEPEHYAVKAELLQEPNLLSAL